MKSPLSPREGTAATDVLPRLDPIPPAPVRRTSLTPARDLADAHPGEWVRIDGRSRSLAAANQFRARVRRGDRGWRIGAYECDIRPLDDHRETWGVWIRSRRTR